MAEAKQHLYDTAKKHRETQAAVETKGSSSFSSHSNRLRRLQGSSCKRCTLRWWPACKKFQKPQTHTNWLQFRNLLQPWQTSSKWSAISRPPCRKSQQWVLQRRPRSQRHQRHQNLRHYSCHRPWGKDKSRAKEVEEAQWTTHSPCVHRMERESKARRRAQRNKQERAQRTAPPRQR